MSESRPNRQQILEMMNGFRPACVIGAAAELDLWTALGGQSLSAEQLAEKLHADLRATTILLDAVAALGLLEKRDIHYSVPPDLRGWLVEDSPETILPMLRHAMTILRSWSQLAWVAKSGIPAPRSRAFAGRRPIARASSPPCTSFPVRWPTNWCRSSARRSSAVCSTWAAPRARGRWRFSARCPPPRPRSSTCPTPSSKPGIGWPAREFADRVTLVAGDFYADDLPGGADFAWVSAICHQHSRRHNRELFAKVFRALAPGGRIAMRDVVMEPSRTGPREGALFAINMLVNTDSGGTFTFDEYAEDLQIRRLRESAVAGEARGDELGGRGGKAVGDHDEETTGSTVNDTKAAGTSAGGATRESDSRVSVQAARPARGR